MASSPVLYAAAKEIGATCEEENLTFLQCKAGNIEPSVCLDKGAAVQACALRVLKNAMDSCQQSFEAYTSCIDAQISEEYMFERCRDKETAFAKCRVQAREGGSLKKEPASKSAS